MHVNCGGFILVTMNFSRFFSVVFLNLQFPDYQLIKVQKFTEKKLCDTEKLTCLKMSQAFYPTNDGHIGNLAKLTEQELKDLIARQTSLLGKRYKIYVNFTIVFLGLSLCTAMYGILSHYHKILMFNTSVKEVF